MKIGDIVFVFVCVILISISVKSCHESKVRKSALNECIDEISSKCSRSIQYAIALEDENARLNRVIKEYRANESR